MMAEMALSELTERLGEAHPETLESMYQFAWNEFNQGRWAEGEALEPGVVRQAMHLMSDDDAVEAAGAIFTLYDSVRSACYERDG